VATPPLRSRLLEAQAVGGATVAHLLVPSILQETEIKRLGDDLDALCAGEKPRLVLDLSTLTHMSSALLSKLFGLHLRLEKAGGRLALCGVRPDLWKVFEITQLAGRFHAYATEWAALESFGSAGR
jgi:anti-sigma B factor antagonist